MEIGLAAENELHVSKRKYRIVYYSYMFRQVFHRKNSLIHLNFKFEKQIMLYPDSEPIQNV